MHKNGVICCCKVIIKRAHYLLTFKCFWVQMSSEVQPSISGDVQTLINIVDDEVVPKGGATNSTSNTLQSREQRCRLLVYGYIREHISDVAIRIPTEIMETIYDWFYVVSLKKLAYDMTDEWDHWDQKTINKVLQIKDDTVLTRPTARGTNPYGFGSQSFDSGITIWRFKVVKKECYWIGIVDAKNAIRNSHDIQTSGKIKSNSYFASLFGGRYCKTEYSQLKAINLSGFEHTGDVICMMVDMKQKKIFFSVNEEDFVCGFHNIDATQYKFGCSIQQDAEFQLVSSIHFET
eukprot:100304_1